MLAPIKVKICDRNKDMLTAFGDKSAQVETQDGRIVIKKKEDILPTDRVLTYIPNDYISPIKIKIIDLDVVLAFLSGELARLAFFTQINIDGVRIFRYGKPIHKLKFWHLSDGFLTKSFGKSHEKNTIKGIIEKATSVFEITTKSCSVVIGHNIKVLSTINEKYLLPQKFGFNIPQISAIIYALRYKTVEDITKDTLNTQFFEKNSLSEIFSIREEV